MILRERITRWLSVPLNILLRHRTTVKTLLHVAIFIVAYLGAYLVRFDLSIPPEFIGPIRQTIPAVLVSKALVFLAFGLFHGWWRYVSLRDVLPIAGGCTFGSLIFWGIDTFLMTSVSVPRSVYAIDWGLTLLMVLGVRYFIRFGRETIGRRRSDGDKRVLIVGAGAAGQMIAREIIENVSLGMEQVGFVDDDREKIGTRIHGIKVLGGHAKIADICAKFDVNEIIIAIPSAPASVVRHVVEHCREVSATFRILPGIGDLIDGKVSVRALRNVDLEDLLGRDPVALDTGLLERHITGRTVMVTGAAGSIGSELCRQIARCSPGRLILFEIAESPLFFLEMEMRKKFPTQALVPVIGDVRDRGRVEEIVRVHRPAIIFHAAAYKHVPMMEIHPVEAVKTNVLGTRIVAEAAVKFGVERFVLVSTDKAVRPTNVMGASKRLAELVIQNIAHRDGPTVFVAVRFGNVLGSVGSVIPIFRHQLVTTGKLTVTHPEASRYFMLIPEAAGLILQAGAMGEGGEVFVLDMGEPVKIVDLAKNMIRLSGKELGVDAEIVYTGLRPGEKLHEELILEGEDVSGTIHPKVMKQIGNEQISPSWAKRLEELIVSAVTGDRRAVVEKLDGLVKGYRPDYEFHGVPVPATAGDADLPPDPDSPSKSVH
ncbi:MAG: polysaccharide biosynthesis protein [Deltaproteobacteria bacterium]|nr:polysaccharide biosynthesis protein [Deltaproteobacteria bacterium]